jgi:hypothetical protein
MRLPFFLFALLFLPILFASCKKETSNASYRVEYAIDCTDCFVVCYDENGNQKSWYHQNSSFSYGFDGEKGDVVLMVAQNTSQAAAAVTGRIRINGTITQEKTSYCPISGTVIVTDTLR